MSIGDARFFTRSGPRSIATVVKAAGGTTPETDLLLTGVAPLQAAGPDEVSFLDNRRYAAALEKTSAGAVIIHPDMLARVPAGVVPVVTKEPYAGWARVAALFYPAPSSCPACTRRRTSRTARPSILQRRLDLSSWLRLGRKLALAAESLPTSPSPRAW
jgi:hypothetical protein